MKVLKFGGTSVANAERISHVARLVSTGSKPVMVVLSAMAGTTNTLVEIADLLRTGEKARALEVTNTLYDKYVCEAADLFPREDSRKVAMASIDTCFGLIRRMCAGDTIEVDDEKRILAQGELMSTAMMLRHLQDLNRRAVIIPALDYMRTDKEAEPDIPYITHHLTPLLKAAPGDTEIYITEGYVCLNAFDKVDNLRRGGSDYTASLVGVAVKAEEIQIWTDIDGLHNNDPRVVQTTEPVRRLHYEEASELAFFGAKILHPTCILPAKLHNIPVRLLNTLNPSQPGTFISIETERDKIKAVSAKENITAIKIRSDHSLTSYHFLGRIFDIFEQHRTVVDMVTTSDVGVALALTIETDEQLESIVTDLGRHGSIQVEHDLAIVCVVGDMQGDNIGYEARVMDAVRAYPIRMISYGGSNYNMAVLVDAKHKRDVLIALSQHLFLNEQEP